MDQIKVLFLRRELSNAKEMTWVWKLLWSPNMFPAQIPNAGDYIKFEALDVVPTGDYVVYSRVTHVIRDYVEGTIEVRVE